MRNTAYKKFGYSQKKRDTQKKKADERILPFVITYHPAVSNLKQTLMEKWSLIQNLPLLKTIYLKRSIISYKRSKYLKDMLVRSKSNCKAIMRGYRTRGVCAGLSLTYSLKIRLYQKWRTDTREKPGP